MVFGGAVAMVTIFGIHSLGGRVRADAIDVKGFITLYEPIRNEF